MRLPSRAWPALAAVCALVAAIALYLPWHRWGEGPGRPTDTGIVHTGVQPVVLLAGAVFASAYAALDRRRAPWLVCGIASMLVVGGAGALVIVHTLLAHMFSSPDALWGQLLCAGAGAGAFALAVVTTALATRNPR